MGMGDGGWGMGMGSEQRFVDSSKLKRHFLIHTGEKHFVCPFQGCGKAFSLDFNRRSHMRTHTGEKYHTCPVTDCGKRFAHENKLRGHVHAAHPGKVETEGMAGKPFDCPFPACNKHYFHDYKLKMHLRKEHGEAGEAGGMGMGMEEEEGEEEEEVEEMALNEGEPFGWDSGEVGRKRRRGGGVEEVTDFESEQ